MYIMLYSRGVGDGTRGFIYASRALSHWVTPQYCWNLSDLRSQVRNVTLAIGYAFICHRQSPEFHLQHWKLREDKEQNWLDSREYDSQRRGNPDKQRTLICRLPLRN